MLTGIQVYWFVSGACISAYTTGSSLLAYGGCSPSEMNPEPATDQAGLTAQQAMACVVVGAMITGMLSVLSGMYDLCTQTLPIQPMLTLFRHAR